MLLKALCRSFALLRMTTWLRGLLTTKTLLIMKFTAIILLSACLGASANGFSQITLSEKNAPLQKIFKKIQQQSGYEFLYPTDLLQKAGTVNIEVRNVSIEEALEAALKGKSLSFIISDKTIVIKEKVKEPVKEELSPPLIDIKGRVTNENGKAVSATVTVKGTSIAAATNDDGEFELKRVDENATLVITGISIETREIKLSGESELAITVKTRITEEEEIVINAGYYKVRDRERTGSINRVDAKAIEKQPVLNPLATLQGRVPGISITQISGVPGDGFRVEIRGRNSVRGINYTDPLYIIDGIPYPAAGLEMTGASTITRRASPLNLINPADIESIEILKDADATAIYGSRGSNGVVLITTKKGKAAKTKFDFNVYSGFGKATRLMEMLNTQQYVAMRKEAFANDGITPTIGNAPDLLVWDTTRYTDWQKLLIGNTANSTNAHASVSGGNLNTQFLFGGDYYKQTTVFPGDFRYQRGSSHFSLSHVTLNHRFKLNLLVNYGADKNYLPKTDFTVLAVTLQPNAPAIYDANGNLNWAPGTYTSSFPNPLSGLKKIYTSNTKSLVTNADLSYEIFPDLKIKTSLGYTQINMKDKYLNLISSQYPPINPTGTTIQSSANNNTWIIEPQVDYQKQIGKGKLSLLIGTTFQQTLFDKEGIIGVGYTSDAQIENTAAAASLIPLGFDYYQYRYCALFGRVNYNLKGNYIINITGRRDGSSRFGPDKKFANFGAVGAVWIFTNEEFIKSSLPFLNSGRLRASYGTSGSDLIGDYQYLDTYNPANYPYQGAGTLIPTRLVNPDFAWEANKKFDLAIELGFLQDRVSITSNYYHNRTSNQLVGYSLPAITGFTSVQYNLPATVQNTGWEFELNTVNVKSKNIKWTTSVNLAIPRNKLVSYPNLAGSSYATVYAIGKPLYIQARYHYTGVNPQTGIYTFQDVNGNGSLSTPADLQFLKEAAIDFHGGLQNSFTYKNIQLDFLFQFVKQTGQSYLVSAFSAPGTSNNQPIVVLNRWQKPGQNSEIQRFTQTGVAATAYSNARIWGDNSIIDASFIRLKNISLSWEMPTVWKQRVHLQNAKIYFQAQNIFTFTNYLGSDPEAQTYRSLAPLRMLTFGIQLTL
jgi:TonB-linked SusC/RagA family outer membrane protein